MAGFDFTPDEEQQLYSELGQIDSKTKSYQSTASPVVGRYVGDFAKAHPYAVKLLLTTRCLRIKQTNFYMTHLKLL